MNYLWSHDNKRYNAIILSHNNAGYGWSRSQRRTKSSGYSIKFGLLFQHQTKPDSNAHCFAISFLERGMTLSLISGLVKKSVSNFGLCRAPGPEICVFCMYLIMYTPLHTEWYTLEERHECVSIYRTVLNTTSKIRQQRSHPMPFQLSLFDLHNTISFRQKLRKTGFCRPETVLSPPSWNCPCTAASELS